MGGPRYPGGPRGPNVRMPPMGGDFNGVSSFEFFEISTRKCSKLSEFFGFAFQPPGQPMMPNAMDPSRQGKS